MFSVAELIRSAAAREGSCDDALDSPPWTVDHDPRAGYGPGASSADPLPFPVPRQQPLPERYTSAGVEELHGRIIAAREQLGDRVRILGHFYQRDEVIVHADAVGDSFMLARAAREYPQAEAFIFCGVHFMAETADILSRPDQAVLLPNLAAGCSMADMATIGQVEDCWAQLTGVLDQPPIPVTYMNSSAEIKAFCGRNGGIVCTSSNARTVLDWAFTRGRRVVFFPDQHLGRNTAATMGVTREQMPLWRPGRVLGGNTAQQLIDARVILWNGFCSVHRRFTVDQIVKARADHPGVRVIVHPECPAAVVRAADGAGSTDYIRKQIEAAAPGDVIAVGTEINLVNRLQAQHPELTVYCLDPVVCPCSTMYRIHPAYLAWTLESLIDGRTPNRISVDTRVAEQARVALERMLAAKP
ncbi:quinolinate synthase NadA [Corynebacterium pacaense]|uniref:quinolinate synthase NadA n=1 Tax=Corynebacterium pacaense TaxID=1816684 RepID=UPI0009B9D9D9|nr:quinolinate synthase NadA [Corynebacterium pacaense]